MRARIIEHSENNVTVIRDEDGERIEREYWTPDKGGYVREITETHPGTLGYQVCDMLYHMGHTLHRPGGVRLAAIIRRELRARVRDELRQATG